MTEILNKYVSLLLAFDIKAISIAVFLLGLLLLIIYGIHKSAAKVKAAKREYEILQRRGLMDEQTYTTALDKDIVGEDVVKAVLRKHPELKPVAPKAEVEKVVADKPGNTGKLVINPKVTNFSETYTTLVDLEEADPGTKTSLLDMPSEYDVGTKTELLEQDGPEESAEGYATSLLDEEEQETAESYKTTLLD